MKRIACLVSVLVLFVLAGVVYAHPPQDIVITFDPAAKMVTAVITHGVSNPASHYIAKVDVDLNGKEIISQAISRQDNNTNQTVKYYIPDAKAGDTLSVEAYCSISGKLAKEIKIAE